jgi:SAM-dependent methyltransferase
MYDFLKGQEAYEVVERDDGYVQAVPASGYFSEYHDWSPRHKRAMKYVRGRVLDIGCGAGRHSLYLQRKGFDVLGIDISPYAIKTSKLRGLRNAGIMSIAEIGPTLGHFDTLLMMGLNFGLFGTPSKARQFLRRFRGITSSGARIIAETRDPYKTKEAAHLAYHARNRKRGKAAGELRIRVRYKTLQTPWFKFLIVSKPELKEILNGTGWRLRRVLNGSSPSGIYVAIIEKERKKLLKPVKSQ